MNFTPLLIKSDNSLRTSKTHYFSTTGLDMEMGMVDMLDFLETIVRLIFTANLMSFVDNYQIFG